MPVVVSYDDYTFKEGDVVTAAVLDEDLNVLVEHSVTVTGNADEVQLEFTREDKWDISGSVIIEARTVTASNVEMTIQKKITLGKDGIR